MSTRVRMVPLAVGLVTVLALVPGFTPRAEALRTSPCDTTRSLRDLNGDDYDDLVVGDPYATVSGQAEAGSITVLFGGDPLTIGDGPVRRVLTQANFGGTPEPGDHFGWTVALGTTGLTGLCAGLAVGAPGEDVDGRTDAGSGHLGRFDRDPEAVPTTFTGVALDQSDAGGTAEPGDRFGSTVAITGAYANGSRRVAFGAPGEDVGSIRDAGAVNLLRIAATPTAVGELRQGRKLPGSTKKVPGSAQTGDEFGATLVAARLDLGTRSGKNTDRQQALVIGAPGDTVSGHAAAGSVTVVREKLDGTLLFTQNTKGIPGTAEAGDRFGASAAVSFQISNLIREVSFGAPGEDIGPVADAGSVTTLIEKGHTLKHIQTFHQDTARVNDTNEAGDEFGAALAYTDMSMLSVGVPGEDLAGVTDTGAVHNLSVFDQLGEIPPFVAEGSDPVTQDLAGPGSLRANSRFGAVLSTLYGTRERVLAIGDPLTNGGLVLGTSGYSELTHRWQPGRDAVPGPGVRFGQAIA